MVQKRTQMLVLFIPKEVSATEYCFRSCSGKVFKWI